MTFFFSVRVALIRLACRLRPVDIAAGRVKAVHSPTYALRTQVTVGRDVVPNSPRVSRLFLRLPAPPRHRPHAGPRRRPLLKECQPAVPCARRPEIILDVVDGPARLGLLRHIPIPALSALLGLPAGHVDRHELPSAIRLDTAPNARAAAPSLRRTARLGAVAVGEIVGDTAL